MPRPCFIRKPVSGQCLLSVGLGMGTLPIPGFLFLVSLCWFDRDGRQQNTRVEMLSIAMATLQRLEPSGTGSQLQRWGSQVS